MTKEIWADLLAKVHPQAVDHSLMGRLQSAFTMKCNGLSVLLSLDFTQRDFALGFDNAAESAGRPSLTACDLMTTCPGVMEQGIPGAAMLLITADAVGLLAGVDSKASSAYVGTTDERHAKKGQLSDAHAPANMPCLRSFWKNGRRFGPLPLLSSWRPFAVWWGCLPRVRE